MADSKKIMEELDNVLDPLRWIVEVFERLTEEMDERFDRVEDKFNETNRKIDIILQHLTGISDSDNDNS